MSKEKFALIAEQTLNAVKAGKYMYGKKPVPIKDLVYYCVRRTVLYAPGEPDSLPDSIKNKVNYSPKISVTNESTLEAAYRLRDVNPCALNFASAKNPGGGFLRGTVAQEETIARASGLYESLIQCQEYYNKNKKADAFYLDYGIYSKSVPIFRDDACQWLSEPYTVSIVTSPAPKRVQIEQDIKAGRLNISLSKMEIELENVLERRLHQVLRIMANHNHNTIILGAWGCGVFGNNKDIVASVFERGLKRAPWFDEVVFAIYDDKESETFKVFNSTFTR